MIRNILVTYIYFHSLLFKASQKVAIIMIIVTIFIVAIIIGIIIINAIITLYNVKKRLKQSLLLFELQQVGR